MYAEDVSWLLELALRAGPWAAHVVPSAAFALGVLAGLLAARAWVRRHPLRVATVSAITSADEGRRLRVAGRLSRDRVEPSLHVLTTSSGAVPVAGELELEGVRWRDVTEGGVTRRELDAEVVVDGYVGRVMQPALREQAGVLALRDRHAGFFEPIRVRAIRPRARAIGLTLLVAASGAAGIALLAPMPFVPSVVRASLEDADAIVALRLASFTREAALATLAASETQPLWRIEAARRELAADHAPPTRLERGAGAVTHRLTAHGRWVLSYLARVRRDREEWSSLVALKRDATFPRHCALRPPGSLVRSRDGCVQRPSPHCAEWSHSEEPVIEEVGWETKRNYIDVDHPPLEVLAGGSLVYGG